MSFRSILLALAFSSVAVSSSGQIKGAEGTKLILDGLSYISFGDKQVYSIPPGSSIGFRFSESDANGSASFTISPDDVDIGAVRMEGDGEALLFGLAKPASGVMLVGADGTATISFDAQTRVALRHPTAEGMRDVTIHFTTESATAKSLDGKTRIDVAGMRVNRAARAIQLVGTSAVAASDYPEPGEAVYVVLSGVFDTLPSAKRESAQ